MAAAQAGYDVAAQGRNAEDTRETRHRVEALGRRSIGLGGDLANPSTPGRLLASTPETVTLLINNASVFQRDEIADLSAQSLDDAWSINLRAPVLLAQAFAAALPAEQDGLIVNVVDQRVWRLNPRMFSYTLSKAGLWAATQTLAQALAPRIRVNAIGPGPVLPSVHQTSERFAGEAAATPLGVPVALSEIAAALTYLIDARAVTGQMVAVDAGQHLAWQTPDVGHD